MAATHTSRSLEEMREQGRRGGLNDGKRRRATLEQQIAGMSPLEIYRYGYQAGYRVSSRTGEDVPVVSRETEGTP